MKDLTNKKALVIRSKVNTFTHLVSTFKLWDVKTRGFLTSFNSLYYRHDYSNLDLKIKNLMEITLS